MQWEKVKLEDIKCGKIRNNIEICSRSINNFVKLINTELDDDEKLCNPTFIILRRMCDVYENDGNTTTDGYSYKVYWAFSLSTDKSVDIFYLQNEMQEQCLYFEYKQTERIRDHIANSLRFLTLYMCGVEFPGSKGIVKRIDYNNDNMEVNSIINVSNAATCILEIKEIKKRVRLTERLKNKLKECYNKED